MPQHSSLEVLFARLREWSRFPKYSLERRIDIFLTPFLAPFLSARMEAPVTLVAPEFPIKLESSNQSVNVDYLLRRDGRSPAWLFLELKTDPRSLRDEQRAHYLRAKAKGMGKVLADLDPIRKATLPVHRPKYDELRRAVDESGPPMDQIDIVYLSPESPAPDGVIWFSLQDFASWSAPEHRELWTEVTGLLRTLKR